MDKEKICDSLAQNGGSMAVSGQIGGFLQQTPVFIRSLVLIELGVMQSIYLGEMKEAEADYLPEFPLKFDMVSV